MALEAEIYKKLAAFSLSAKFTAANDAVTGVLGASGCGKSMVLRCIAGIEMPDEGKISLNGRVIFDSAKKINLSPQARRVGYLFQSYALFPHMTVEENILAGVRDKKNAPFLLEKYLKLFYLEDLAKRYPKGMSGGQQQRAALARIFASEPELLMLDEPFSALDSYLKWKVGLELRAVLKGYGKPILFVSHDRDEIYTYCDRAAVLNDGKMAPVCDKHLLFSEPKNLAASKLTGCKNHSRFQRTAENKILAADWNIELKFDEIPNNAAFIGVRAHDFEIADFAGENIFRCIIKECIEKPFSYALLIQPSGGMGEICVEIERALGGKVKNKREIWLKIPSEAVFFLEE
jgi:molybdate transport system ATP-binding protein